MEKCYPGWNITRAKGALIRNNKFLVNGYGFVHYFKLLLFYLFIYKITKSCRKKQAVHTLTWMYLYTYFDLQMYETTKPKDYV